MRAGENRPEAVTDWHVAVKKRSEGLIQQNKD
jgi:hypothetical protein